MLTPTKTLLLIAIALMAASALFALWRFGSLVPGLTRDARRGPLGRTWRYWAMLQASGVLVCAIVTLFDGLPAQSTMSYARNLFLPMTDTDSWMPMQEAVEQLQQHPDAPLYQSVFFGQRIKFQYPLSSLLLLDIPRWFFGAEVDSTILAYQVLSRLCVVAIGVVFYLLMTGAIRDANPDMRQERLSPLAHASLLGLSLFSVALFFPIARAEAIGQIQNALTLLAALALLAWQRGRPVAAGVLIALCTCVKPQWAFLIVWALARREWRFARAAAITCAAVFGLTLAVYGLDNMLDYLSVLSYLSRHGESYFINQSVNGLMNRLLFNGVNLELGPDWIGSDIPPYHPTVHMATVVTSALILGAAMFWRLRQRPTTLDLGLVMLSLTIASPVAWDHHYGVLLPIFAVALPTVMNAQPFARWTAPLLWLGFVLTSQTFVTATSFLAGSRFNILQSYVLFGGLLMLAVLYRTSHLQHGPARRQRLLWPSGRSGNVHSGFSVTQI